MYSPGDISISRAMPLPKWNSSAPVKVPERSIGGTGVAEGAGDRVAGSENDGVGPFGGAGGTADVIGSTAATGGGSSIVVDVKSGEPRYQPSGRATPARGSARRCPPAGSAAPGDPSATCARRSRAPAGRRCRRPRRARGWGRSRPRRPARDRRRRPRSTLQLRSVAANARGSMRQNDDDGRAARAGTPLEASRISGRQEIACGGPGTAARCRRAPIGPRRRSPSPRRSDARHRSAR